MTDLNPAAPQVLILGLDTFARKNVTQIRSLEAEGYAFTVVTNDQRGDSREIFEAQGFAASRLIVVRGFRDKLLTAWRLLRTGRFHHVELGAAGRMGLAYFVMLRALRVRFLIVERGDVGTMANYGWLTRASLKLAYRFADRIVYKETYMEAPLRHLTRAPLDFVPNCVASAPREADAPRPIQFLWVNRIVPERRAEWLIGAVLDDIIPASQLVFLGIEDRANIPAAVLAVQDRALAKVADGIAMHGFVDPMPYYAKARFFCLPAQVVFGNNSLLEAMSFGVVPVVTRAPGVELIVEDGVNGFVTDFTEAAYHAGLVRASALSPEEWQLMSSEAARTVRDNYSITAWTKKMTAVYARM